MPIIVSIDLRKIDQSKCKSHANGAKYCELVLLPRDDNYGNSHMVVQGVSQEDRKAGVKGAILGNAKDTDRRHQQPQSQYTPPNRDPMNPRSMSGEYPRAPRPGQQRELPKDPELDPDEDGDSVPF